MAAESDEQRTIEALERQLEQRAGENARLFNEVQDALAGQTATAEVLQTISRSAFDLGDVLQTVIDAATRLCRADVGQIYRRYGDVYRSAAMCGPIRPDYRSIEEKGIINPGRDTLVGRVAIDRRAIEIEDAWTDPDYGPKADARIGNLHSMLGVPLIRDGDFVGVLALARERIEPYSKREIGLVRSFADQAVIAIENARLFEEVKGKTDELEEALEQQIATSEVLSVISSSAGDLAPVFEAILGRAMQLCGASFGVLNTYDGKTFQTEATFGLPPAYDAYRRSHVLIYGPATAPTRLLAGEPFVEIPDLVDSEAYRSGEPNRRALVDLGGARSLLAVPLMKDGAVEGNVMIFRQEHRRFSEKQIGLLQQFAAQAVIAIENARLLNELRNRTTDLSRSLADLRDAQDRLVQTEKLASLGQLTAGIAHEIKNPLNFVNNFASLSVELATEIETVLTQERLSDAGREQIEDLTKLLKDNLTRVVQHGQRADSIVRSMLLHSREGAGERRTADINMLVRESLNLAYHGARAEKADFNIRLDHDLDPEAGALELYPQDITRALLNLISNGFYAATKRKLERGDETFEPALIATTRTLGASVEIRIRDNGNGIPPDLRDRIFNPFFTTKPTGEGTGLGLSITHDIVVKQHGGRIDLATEPGAFTEFIITLPRTVGNESAA